MIEYTLASDLRIGQSTLREAAQTSGVRGIRAEDPQKGNLRCTPHEVRLSQYARGSEPVGAVGGHDGDTER